jgi:hypothetical protein
VKQRSIICGIATFVAVSVGVAADHWRWTAVSAAAEGFSPNNLVVSRSVYQGTAPLITVGQQLPGAVATTFKAGASTTGGVVASTSGLAAGNPVQITEGATSFTVTLTTVNTTTKAIAWTPALSAAPASGASCLPLAAVNGSYPGVWANETPDASFGVTSPIFLDQMTPEGALLNSLQVRTSQIVTSFSSKSELALNLSTDRTRLTFMGYVGAGINALDVSNANTVSPTNDAFSTVDPTNPVTSSFNRGVAVVDSAGIVRVTQTTAYSGNNGRAALLNNANGANVYYMSGNAGNGGNPQPAGIILGAGSQILTPGQSPSLLPTPLGSFSISQLKDPANPPNFYAPDKVGKDTNFRGLTTFGQVLYLTKGSGGNGINTVYFVDTTGQACPSGSATPGIGLPHSGAILPLTPTAFTNLGNAASIQTNGLVPTNMCVLAGFPTTLAKNLMTPTTDNFPFGVWFADAITVYVADEGQGAAGDMSAGLQKWVFNGATSQWEKKYVLQQGLNRFQPYSVPNGPHGEVYPTNLNPATDGLRNLTGRVNGDGTVTIWAITSTVSLNVDQGADPNQLVMITDNLANTTSTGAAQETFKVLRTARFGEVLRGVSFTPAVPSTKDDCKDGGWSELVRSDGTPFKNQGACVSYVERNDRGDGDQDDDDQR